MTVLNVTTAEGVVHRINGEAGVSVMENLRDNGIDEMLAICGGCLSCATCHVFVDDAYLDRMPPISTDEEELLASVADRRPNSRLSCQIEFSGALDGLGVTIPSE